MTGTERGRWGGDTRHGGLRASGPVRCAARDDVLRYGMESYVYGPAQAAAFRGPRRGVWGGGEVADETLRVKDVIFQR